MLAELRLFDDELSLALDDLFVDKLRNALMPFGDGVVTLDDGKGTLIQAVSESKCSNALPSKSAAERLADRCRAKLGVWNKEVQEGKKTENQTYMEAMQDPEMVEYLRTKGMPGLPSPAPGR